MRRPLELGATGVVSSTAHDDSGEAGEEGDSRWVSSPAAPWSASRRGAGQAQPRARQRSGEGQGEPEG